MLSGKRAIVIGGGHNGLTCAAYLADAGIPTVLVEAGDSFGGAAKTIEFAPGYKVSAVAHILHLLHPQIERDLNLRHHGLALSARDMATVALDGKGRAVTLRGAKVIDDPAGLASAADQEALEKLMRRLKRIARTLSPFLATKPPRLGTRNRDDLLTLAHLGWQIRSLGRDDMREFLRLAGMNVADVLEDVLTCDPVKGSLAFDAVLGTHMGPRSPGSLFTLLYRLAGKSAGRRGALAHPLGGMGAVSAALEAAARSSGVEMRSGVAVTRILVENDRVCGVDLANGERLESGIVVSATDPKRTFLELLGTAHLDTGFARDVKNIRLRGTTAKLNLALDGLPDFAGVLRGALGERLVIAPDIDTVERAFNNAKYGELPEQPVMEITIPSLHDQSLAPEGHHVLSAVVQFAPYNLKVGWDAVREDFKQSLIDTLARHAPELPGRIVASQVITPLDLERDYGLSGGQWHHGELALDRLLMLRPVAGAAQYAAPVAGLYLGSAGCHPGGGVMGLPGRNAAQAVIAREAKV